MLTLKISYPGNYCSPEVDEQFRELINQQCNYESFDTEFGFGNREIVDSINREYSSRIGFHPINLMKTRILLLLREC